MGRQLEEGLVGALSELITKVYGRFCGQPIGSKVGCEKDHMGTGFMRTMGHDMGIRWDNVMVGRVRVEAGG